jgi:hypothetical protein
MQCTLTRDPIFKNQKTGTFNDILVGVEEKTLTRHANKSVE